MIPNGTNIKNESESKVRSADSSLTQLLMFNTKKRGRKDSHAMRHNLDRECALPLYIGLKIHNKTRKRELVDIMYERGLYVSYDRLLNVSTDEANQVITIYEQEGVVCVLLHSKMDCSLLEI